MSDWTHEEFALLWRHLLWKYSNKEVAEITGRSIEEVAARRLQANYERNNWPEFDPERDS